ncbi:MAG TPA: RNA polymerase sigma factor [Verrucomicrobiae bacterium]
MKYSQFNMGLDPEVELLKRCRRGDAGAWDQLFDLHYAAALRFIYQLSHDFALEDAEEICQETFLSVIRNIGSFHGQSRFQTWLFRVAGNKARDYVERQRAAKRGGGQQSLSLQAEDPETGLTLDPPSTAPPPDLALLNSEQMGLVREALDRLGGACQEIIQLRYFGDLGYDEISRSLELNVKTVSSRLSKCLDRLQEIANKLFAGEKQPLSRLTSSGNGIRTTN